MTVTFTKAQRTEIGTILMVDNKRENVTKVEKVSRDEVCVYTNMTTPRYTESSQSASSSASPRRVQGSESTGPEDYNEGRAGCLSQFPHRPLNEPQTEATGGHSLNRFTGEQKELESEEVLSGVGIGQRCAFNKSC